MSGVSSAKHHDIAHANPCLYDLCMYVMCQSIATVKINKTLPIVGGGARQICHGVDCQSYYGWDCSMINIAKRSFGQISIVTLSFIKEIANKLI